MFRLLVDNEFTFRGVYSNYADAAAAIEAAKEEYPDSSFVVQELHADGDTSEWVEATDPEAAPDSAEENADGEGPAY